MGSESRVTKSLSTVLEVEKNKKINTLLSINIEIIIDFLFTVLISVKKA